MNFKEQNNTKKGDESLKKDDESDTLLALPILRIKMTSTIYAFLCVFYAIIKFLINAQMRNFFTTRDNQR